MNDIAVRKTIDTKRDSEYPRLCWDRLFRRLALSSHDLTVLSTQDRTPRSLKGSPECFSQFLFLSTSNFRKSRQSLLPCHKSLRVNRVLGIYEILETASRVHELWSTLVRSNSMTSLITIPDSHVKITRHLKNVDSNWAIAEHEWIRECIPPIHFMSIGLDAQH
jgi:hypothetical protein